MNARKVTSVAGVVAVALVAAAISYDHQQHLAATHGQPALLAAIWPLCTDGMIASCATTVALDRAGGFRPRTWAVSGFWLGVAVSILTNWLATSGGVIAHGVCAFPALAFLITIEALSSRPRPPPAGEGRRPGDHGSHLRGAADAPRAGRRLTRHGDGQNGGHAAGHNDDARPSGGGRRPRHQPPRWRPPRGGCRAPLPPRLPAVPVSAKALPGGTWRRSRRRHQPARHQRR